MSVAWSSHLSNAREQKTILMQRQTLFLSGLGALTPTLESKADRAVRNQRDTATGKEKEEYRTFSLCAHTYVMSP